MLVLPTDPPGTYFHACARATPEGQWDYALYDSGVLYGPGLWPFYRGKPPRPTGVGMAPATPHRGWLNEYIALRPNPRTAHLTARLILFIRSCAGGGLVADTHLAIDLHRHTAALADGCPAELRDQATAKTARILAFLTEHRHARDRGGSTPETAAMRARKQRSADETGELPR